ncbi:DUF3606 domain-containing protein [Mesorhizobium yinganensis]|uniref:DUF3606 domain-containing protein n=1 Tax=Mesorhizobium yinganensis TaxID=3157707 RepID=UPI0032B726AD
MNDNKSKRDNRDRSRVAADEEYEVQYFAGEAGISVDQVHLLIERFGNDREVLMREARRLGS